MARSADLTIRILGDASSANRAMKQASGGVGGFAKSVGGAVVAAAKWATIAGGAIAGVGILTAGFASDLNESRNKTRVVFGDMSKAVEGWAKTSAVAMGISEQAALESVATFGNLFDAMGLADKPAANMSQNLVHLASDLASFNNIDPAVALEKLRAGIVGEAEPLRTLGVNISEARTKQKALEMGLYSGTGAISAAAKAQANYALIVEDTVNAQGDFARTSGGMANQQRTLSAVFADTMAAIGQAVVPLMEMILPTLTTLLTAFSSWFTDNAPMIQSTIGQVGAAIGKAFTFLIEDVLPVLIDLFGEWATNVLPLVLDALGTLAFDIVPKVAGAIGKIIETVLPTLIDLSTWFAKNVLPALLDAFAAIADWMEENGPLIASIFGTAFRVIAAVIKAVWPIIEAVARILFPLIGAAVSTFLKVVDYVFKAIEGIVKVVVPIVSAVLMGIVGVLAVVGNAFTRIWKTIGRVVDDIAHIITARWKPIGEALSGPFEAAVGIIDDAFKAIRRIIATAVGWIEDIVGGVADIIDGVADALPGGRSSAFPPVVVTPAVVGASAPAPTSSTGGLESRRRVTGTINVTHHIDDPNGALSRVPGGAAAVADMLNRGTDASGLYRQLQHAAGIV